jgi:hypothetical protein
VALAFEDLEDKDVELKLARQFLPFIDAISHAKKED